jgi:hypothetical protein
MDRKAECSVVIDLPCERAWEKLCDLGLAHCYVPGIVRTEITTGRRTGVGASRRVYQSESRCLDETVVEWREGSGFVIRLHKGDRGPPPPFRSAAFRYWIEPEGHDRTRLTTTLSYAVRWGLLGRCLDALVLAKAIRANVRDVASGLKDFYETGVAVTPARHAELRAARRARTG